MNLAPGTTLDRYRIDAPLGEGGMGVVYRATDTALGRTVALKLLPEAFSHDPERIARLEREARVLASLNHPNIAAIYGLESFEGHCFLAMEYVPGETLAQRLTGGAIPLAEALSIARAIAEALESAHEKGVVHRDLKPANVVIGQEGEVKLLDFGLARAFAPEGAAASLVDDSPTISALMTRGDVILGTAAYMSPEQARGRLVDRRSDIWSFGLVLFEMLTGKRVFDGETTSDLLASVLREEIPWARLPALPDNVRALLERCLTRDPKERLRDIGEARIALARAPSTRLAVRRSPAGWLAVPIALLIGALAWFAGRATAPKPPAGARRTLEVLAVADPQRATPALSPDGKALAYADRGALWVRNLDQLESRALVTDAQAHAPFWSPDARTIGYFSGSRILRVSVAGGDVETIADFGSESPRGGEGGAWREDGHIIASLGHTGGLMELSEHGGEAKAWLAADTTIVGDFHEPFRLPGDRGFLVVAHRKAGLDNISLARKGKLTTLLDVPGKSLGRPQYSPTGHIVFERSTPPRGVWAVPFSLARMRTTGEPFLVVPEGSQPSVAGDGTLAYVAVPAQTLQFAWLDRNGAVAETLATLGTALEDGGRFDLSPDGTRVVTVRGSGVDLWLYDFARGTNTRLTSGAGLEANARWTADGTHLIYQEVSSKAASGLGWSIVRIAASGTGKPDTLASGGALSPAVSPDGSTLVYTQFSAGTAWDLIRVTLAGPRNETRLTNGHVNFAARISPDGRWVAYNESEGLPSGRPRVMLTPLATPGDAMVVGTGLWPTWSARGDRLYFVLDDEMMEVTIGAGDPPAIGRPARLFTRPKADVPMVFDWKPQFAVRGDRFLVLKPVDAPRSAGVVLVENWLSGFAARR